VHNVLDAVAPGGTLIILSHDLEAMRDPQHGHRPFDPDAYLHIDDFVTAIKAAAGWTIEVDDKRPRPPGSAGAAHHADDRVLRARRAS
ncbi:MAG: SAM-dependent methyltransferase, partial [Kitasatospora sp.]|nr:SAM-dependent methyltransferase [Kitasatospora sp.]